MQSSILYFHNDPEYVRNTAFMESKNLNVFAIDTYESACAVFTHNPIYLILIDLTLQDSSGIDFIRCLRDKGIFTPAILTIEASDQFNFLEAINLNITQCLIKPYTQQNLFDALKIAHKKSILCHPLTYANLNFGYSYDPINKYIISAENKIIHLCNKEALLIELLIHNGKTITSYEMIDNIVWQDSFMSVESLRTLIRGIRHKTHKNIITNHNGIGYQLNISE